MEPKFPPQLSSTRELTTSLIWWANSLTHIVITIALTVSILVLIWLFIAEVYQSITSGNLAHGFLHALGTLMILWVVSSLILAEARYLEGYPVPVALFVEVALVIILRRIITFPVQEVTPTPAELGAWVGSALALGAAYFLVARAPREGGSQRREVEHGSVKDE